MLRTEDGHDEFTIRTVPCSHLKVLKSPELPRAGEGLTVIGCASEAALNRLLDRGDSEASEDGAQGASDEEMKECDGKQKAQVLSLQPQLQPQQHLSRR